jgi:hypothetical protein
MSKFCDPYAYEIASSCANNLTEKKSSFAASYTQGIRNWFKSLSRNYSKRKSALQARFPGWRGGVLVCIALASFVLSLNCILAIVMAAAWPTKLGFPTAYVGSCKVTSRSTTALHFIINLLSTVLLGAANYCMQRLVAPTRKEIDKSHELKDWLDIGIPSVRNLSAISWKKVVLWVLLGVSSVPLHFL